MSTIPVLHNHAYDINVPTTHRFNGTKFSKLLMLLQEISFANRLEFLESKPVSYKDVTRTHALGYVQDVLQGTLSKEEVRQINLPLNRQLIKRSFLALNGTYQTALQALSGGIACHAAGGTHHAHFDRGSGFCVFNDLAFTALNLIEHRFAKNVLILDLDVHQGDGTVDICHDKKGIYTCSMHCETNFPFKKRNSTLDVSLDRDLEDAAYLNELYRTLVEITKEFQPDIVLYDAGVDVFWGDQLGSLSLTLDGIYARDCNVLEYFKRQDIPIATVIGGGYSSSEENIARRHLSIFQAAAEIF